MPSLTSAGNIKHTKQTDEIVGCFQDHSARCVTIVFRSTTAYNVRTITILLSLERLRLSLLQEQQLKTGATTADTHGTQQKQ